MSMLLAAFRTAAAKSVAESIVPCLASRALSTSASRCSDGAPKSETEKSEIAEKDTIDKADKTAPEANVTELTAAVDKLTKQLQEKESKLHEVIV